MLRAQVHWSLGYHRERGFRLHAHCESHVDGVPCNHSALLDWDTLISTFGADFVVPEDRARFIAALSCSKCGSKHIGLVLLPPHR